MMIVQVIPSPRVRFLRGLRVDLELQQLSEVFRCPPYILDICMFMASPPSSDGRSIFRGYDDYDSKMVARNVEEVIHLKEKHKEIREQKQAMNLAMKLKLKEENRLRRMKWKERKEKRKLKHPEEQVMKLSRKRDAGLRSRRTLRR